MPRLLWNILIPILLIGGAALAAFFGLNSLLPSRAPLNPPAAQSSSATPAVPAAKPAPTQAPDSKPAPTPASTANKTGVPARQEGSLVQLSATPLTGDVAALEQKLAQAGPVRYRILVVDDANGSDKNDYVGLLATKWNEPRADTLLLVIFAREGFDIRFYMGTNFHTKGVTVADLLGMIRGQYFPKTSKGDAAGGLIALIQAVDQRMSQ